MKVQLVYNFYVSSGFLGVFLVNWVETDLEVDFYITQTRDLVLLHVRSFLCVGAGILELAHLKDTLKSNGGLPCCFLALGFCPEPEPSHTRL